MKPEQLFNAPVPGQSLTRSPEQKGPWEQPPKFIDPEDALDHLFGVVMSKQFASHLATIVSKDKKAFIDRIASSMLQEGFLNGLWTVDMMMLLVEPLVIMLVYAASLLDATVSFSTDSGYEDRTGFDYFTDAVLGQPADDAMIQQPTSEDKAEASEATGDNQGTESPTAPNPTAPRQSPLVGG